MDAIGILALSTLSFVFILIIGVTLYVCIKLRPCHPRNRMITVKDGHQYEEIHSVEQSGENINKHESILPNDNNKRCVVDVNWEFGSPNSTPIYFSVPLPNDRRVYTSAVDFTPIPVHQILNLSTESDEYVAPLPYRSKCVDPSSQCQKYRISSPANGDSNSHKFRRNDCCMKKTRSGYYNVREVYSNYENSAVFKKRALKNTQNSYVNCSAEPLLPRRMLITSL